MNDDLVCAKQLVFLGEDSVPRTTSLVIAAETRNSHRATLQLIRNNLADFEDFAGVAFQMQPFDTNGGVQHREVAILTEPQATLLVTYMRNNAVVREFKKRLVAEFYAMRTRLAAASATPDLTDPDVALDKIIELATLAKHERAARQQAEAYITQIEPLAVSQMALSESYGDYRVADAAKVLSRDPAITIGERRLFAFMAASGWVFKNRGSRRWKAFQSQVDIGRLTEKIGQRFWHAGREEWTVPEPTVRITPKGLHDLHKALRGQQGKPKILEAT